MDWNSNRVSSPVFGYYPLAVFFAEKDCTELSGKELCHQQDGTAFYPYPIGSEHDDLHAPTYHHDYGGGWYS